MTITLTIALAVTVTYYGAALLWQYHAGRKAQREMQTRLRYVELVNRHERRRRSR